MEGYVCLRLALLGESENTFLSALDAEGIEHSRVELHSVQPRASGVVEIIAALSDAMPWNAIAKVMVRWVDARKSRKIVVTTEDNQSFRAEGYSIKEMEKLLSRSINVVIVDAESNR